MSLQVFDPTKILDTRQSDAINAVDYNQIYAQRLKEEQTRQQTALQQQQMQAVQQNALMQQKQEQERMQGQEGYMAAKKWQMSPNALSGTPMPIPKTWNYGQMAGAQQATQELEKSQDTTLKEILPQAVALAKATKSSKGIAALADKLRAKNDPRNEKIVTALEGFKNVDLSTPGEYKNVRWSSALQAVAPPANEQVAAILNGISEGEEVTLTLNAQGQVAGVSQPVAKEVKESKLEGSLPNQTGESLRTWAESNKHKFANEEVYTDALNIADNLEGMSKKDKTIYRENIIFNRNDSGKILNVKSVEKTAPGAVIKHYYPAPTSGGTASEDVKAIGDAIISGKQPPDLNSMSRGKEKFAIQAYLAKNNYDLATASLDWLAMKKHIASLNNAQQLRLKEVVDQVSGQIPLLRKAAADWKSKGLGQLSKANIFLAKNGAKGTKAQILATTVDALTADIVSELGTIYKGGNASTNDSLKLAQQNLKTEWDEKTFSNGLDLIEKNIAIRKNSIKNVKASGLSTSGEDSETPVEPSIKPPAKSTGSIMQNLRKLFIGGQ